MQNLKKFLQRSQSYEDVPFLGPKWSLCTKQNFFINIILMFLLAPFIVQNFKKNLPVDPELRYEDAQFLDPKWPISPNETFFSENLLMSLISFIHAYLHAKNQSQILIYSWNIDD